MTTGSHGRPRATGPEWKVGIETAAVLD